MNCECWQVSIFVLAYELVAARHSAMVTPGVFLQGWTGVILLITGVAYLTRELPWQVGERRLALIGADWR